MKKRVWISLICCSEATDTAERRKEGEKVKTFSLFVHMYRKTAQKGSIEYAAQLRNDIRNSRKGKEKERP